MGNAYTSLSGLGDEAAAHVAASRFVHKMASVAILVFSLLLQIPFPRCTFTYQSLWKLAYIDIGVWLLRKRLLLSTSSSPSVIHVPGLPYQAPANKEPSYCQPKSLVAIGSLSAIASILRDPSGCMGKSRCGIRR